MNLKPVRWIGDSLVKLRQSPDDIRSKAGHQLERIQAGRVPDDFRPMPTVGAGVEEIRVHGMTEYRVFYVARFEEAVYVLHCFTKKTRTTSTGDIELARTRYAALIGLRRAGRGRGTE